MALLRSVATVGSWTLLSRLFGFARDMLTAAVLGAGPVADAFFIAQRLPNLFRTLFAEGAFSAAFVPLFAGTIAEHGGAAARRFAEEVFAALLAALVAFVLLGEVLMPEVMGVIAPGFDRDPGKFALVIDLTRITFPYLLFISLVALQAGILNSLDRFAAAAATPILLNLFLIAALGLTVRFGWHDGRALAAAVTLAGLAQFLWLLLSCARAGMALRLRPPRVTPGVRRTLRIMAPGVVGAGVTQINVVISTALASLLPGGSVSYLWYAERLNQLPLGVVGIAVGTAILPSLSRQVRAGDNAAAVATQNRGLELALLLTLPAAVGLAVLAQPILAALFERGAFGPAEVAATAPALAAYAAGLPAFVLVKVLVPGFFARQDTAAPVKIALLAMAVNLALSLALMGPLAHVGLAIALSAAGWTNALILFALLSRRGHFALDRRGRRGVPRIAASAVGMGVVLIALRLALAPAFAGPLITRLGALSALICAGTGVFAGLALAFGVADWRLLRDRLARESKSGDQPA
ncbi:MAG: murein biosynthesis integral membrane protein MurJ [Alphaproteobacteria bacterium]|nr:murein biosynthesis integral membrane protein MurJ [Alphaproteobacteria bacterium]